MEHHGSPWANQKEPVKVVRKSSPGQVNLVPPTPTRLEAPKPPPVIRRSSCDLFECIEQRSKLSENEARYVFAQVVSIMHFLHQRGVYHMDLKDENIVIDQKLKVSTSLLNFGLADLTYLASSSRSSSSISDLLFAVNPTRSFTNFMERWHMQPLKYCNNNLTWHPLLRSGLWAFFLVFYCLVKASTAMPMLPCETSTMSRPLPISVRTVSTYYTFVFSLILLNELQFLNCDITHG